MALEIAGWFASAALAKLADAICPYIGDQYEYQSGAGIKRKLESLESNMRKIEAVMHEADQRQIENPGLKKWLLELKGACYDAEDVVDMFEYQLLEDKAKGKNQVSNNFAQTSRRISKRARVIVKRFLFCDDELNDLLESVDRFEKLVKDMGSLLPLLNSIPTNRARVDEIMLSRETTSIPAEPQLFGREEEKNLLKRLLLQTVDRRKHVHFGSIVGTGGVGKTSLAQDVYNDPTLTNHFDLRAWVCVSKDFDVKRLVKEIIESASISQPNDFQNLKNLDRIAEILKNGLMGKKFLIILDDIWDEPPKNWEVLLSILNSGLDGSRVIITTRNQKLAGMMKAESITLKGLRGDEYWDLFVKYALGGESPNEYPALEIVGKKIVEKLRGNPLAAKIVGRVLNQKLEVDHWREILNSNLWKVDDGIMSVLRLSYDYLPGHLKPCFVYSSLFPQDYQYSEDELVQLWIAQGYIQPQESKTMEQIGKFYLNELLGRCFFQKQYNSKYVIHDLLHELAEYLFEGELLRIEDYQPEKKLSERVRHAYIHSVNLSLLCNNEYAKKYLRSLVICGSSKVSLDILSELKGIRVLIILDQRVGLLPKSLGQMLHLRYLKISQGATCEIPESITKLYHLQVLEVQSSYYFPKGRLFPKGTNKLICLRHLVPNDRVIAGIGSLTSLQELEFYTRKDEHGYEIRQLRDMLQLRLLSISGLESVENTNEASTAELCSKRNLEILKLIWQEGGHVVNPTGVLEGLKPHRNLKDLQIFGYGGRSPSWLKDNLLSNLSCISLEGCANWDILPSLGQLLSLRTLYLHEMGGVRKIGREFYGSSSGVAFPSLESLDLTSMPELEEWCCDVEGLQLFPRLSELNVDECPKLRGPLYVPSPLTTLDVKISILSDDMEGPFISFKSPKMGFTCPTITRLTEWIPRHNLASVEEMSIHHSGGIMELDQTTLPTEVAEWFQHLTSLQSLTIKHCDNLQSLPPLGQLLSLRTLKMSGMAAVRKIGMEFYGSSSGIAFPSLESLTLWGMPELEEWCSNVEGLQLFPRLSFLRVLDCPKLRGPLYVLSPLTRLDVQVSNDTSRPSELHLSTPDMFHTLTGGSPHILVMCPTITMLPEWIPRHHLASVEFMRIQFSEEIEELDQTTLPTEVAEWFQHLTSLQSLTIEHCDNLQSLPSLPMNRSLSDLRVRFCPEVRRLPEEGLPISLMELEITDCPLLGERCRKDGPDWHKVAHIPNITI